MNQGRLQNHPTVRRLRSRRRRLSLIQLHEAHALEQLFKILNLYVSFSSCGFVFSSDLASFMSLLTPQVMSPYFSSRLLALCLLPHLELTAFFTFSSFSGGSNSVRKCLKMLRISPLPSQPFSAISPNLQDCTKEMTQLISAR